MQHCFTFLGAENLIGSSAPFLLDAGDYTLTIKKFNSTTSERNQYAGKQLQGHIKAYIADII